MSTTTPGMTNDESTSGAAQAASQAKDMAQETAQQAAGQAKGLARTQVDQRSTQAGERVTSTVSDVRSIAEQLRSQGKDQPAKLAEQAADRAEKVGDYLTNSDADRILHDLERFGRKQPWAVVAGGLALGFVASRFLKASSSRRQEEFNPSQYRTPQTLGAGTYADRAPAYGTPGTPSYGTTAGDRYEPGLSDIGGVTPPRDIVVTGDIPPSRGGSV